MILEVIVIQTTIPEYSDEQGLELLVMRGYQNLYILEGEKKWS